MVRSTRSFASSATLIRDYFQRFIASRALQRVRPLIESRTLREALRAQYIGRRCFLGVPHYWAIYYHDGRGPAYPRKRTRWLVWYPNPKNDPRHRGIYPVRRKEIRSLRDVGYSWDDIMRDVRAGIAVIAKVSPRNEGRVAGHPFFKRGLTGFFNRGSFDRVNLFRRLLRQEIPEAFERRTKRVKLYI